MLAKLKSHKLGVLVAFLMSGGLTYAFPYYSNQNQYLFFVAKHNNHRLLADPLAVTADPYPIFTKLAETIFTVGGLRGLQVASFLCTFLALIGIFTFARLINPTSGRSVPIVSMMIVGSSLLAHGHIQLFSLFQGLANQAVINRPGYFQPSQAGCLLFIAFPLLFRSLQEKAPVFSKSLVAPVVLMVIAAIVHPIYLVVCLVGVAAAFLADVMLNGGLGQFRKYMVIVFVLLVASIAANPSLFLAFGKGVTSGTGAQSQALYRFAFERIPHHTLWNHWPIFTELRLVLFTVLGIAAVSRLRNGKWLAVWFSAVLGFSLVSVFLVSATKSAGLALLFPSRISLIFIPLSCTALAVYLCTWARKLILQQSALRANWVPVSLVLSLMIFCVGTVQTLHVKSPRITDAPTSLVSTYMPRGLGLIPLDKEYLRLNAGYPVYVDWKSPPYKGKDLVDWWKRVDRVRALQSRPELFCSAQWAKSIGWLVQLENQRRASCTSSWLTLGTKNGWILLQRPQQ